MQQDAATIAQLREELAHAGGPVGPAEPSQAARALEQARSERDAARALVADLQAAREAADAAAAQVQPLLASHAPRPPDRPLLLGTCARQLNSSSSPWNLFLPLI